MSFWVIRYSHFPSQECCLVTKMTAWKTGMLGGVSCSNPYCCSHSSGQVTHFVLIPIFSQLKNRNSHASTFRVLFGGLSEMMHLKCSLQGLAYSIAQ